MVWYDMMLWSSDIDSDNDSDSDADAMLWL